MLFLVRGSYVSAGGRKGNSLKGVLSLARDRKKVTKNAKLS